MLDTIADMVTAEAIQLEQRGRFEPNRGTYLQVIQGKTAGLFRFALAAGATLGGLSPEQVAALGQVGNALGLAFQLMDDVLDVEGTTDDLGKDLLVDLREGKLTWPFILAAERDPDFVPMLQAYVAPDADSSAPQASDIIKKLVSTRAIIDTRVFAEAQGEEARQLLAGLPKGTTRAAIEAVIDSAIRRKK
jgi:octaprenyl-diphosphate synthase